MQLERVWVIVRSASPVAQHQASLCAEDLRRQGVQVTMATSGASANPFPGLLASEPILPDLTLVLGGDGTVLGAARYLGPLGIPILSFNVGGHLGFLTHECRQLVLASSSAEDNLWQRLRDDRYSLQRRMMLEAFVDRGDGVPEGEEWRDPQDTGAGRVHRALNDFYFRPCLHEDSPTCLLELEIDGEVVDQFRGDGLIIATSTGSTAYAMAAGGPILHPGIDAIVVNPICPMSLSSRPLVVPPCSRLAVWPLGVLSRRVRIWKDGAHAAVIEPGEHCVIQRSRHCALMVVLDQSPSYYRTLSHKLHWAGDLTAAEPSPN